MFQMKQCFGGSMAMLGCYLPRPINTTQWKNNNVTITTELVSYLIIFDKPIIEF